MDPHDNLKLVVPMIPRSLDGGLPSVSPISLGVEVVWRVVV